MENTIDNEEKQTKRKSKILVIIIISVGLSILLLPVIILALIIVILVIAALTFRDFTGSTSLNLLGFTPLIVQSDSMSINDSAEYGGAFNKGDIILIKKVNPEELVEQDIITYIRDGEIIYHRIIEVIDIEKDEYLPAKQKFEAAKAAYEEALAKYEEAVQNDDPLKNDLEIAMNDAKEEMDKKENTMKYYQKELAKAKYAFNTKGDYQSPSVIRIYDYEVQGKYIFRIPLLGK